MKTVKRADGSIEVTVKEMSKTKGQLERENQILIKALKKEQLDHAQTKRQRAKAKNQRDWLYKIIKQSWRENFLRFRHRSDAAMIMEDKKDLLSD